MRPIEGAKAIIENFAEFKELGGNILLAEIVNIIENCSSQNTYFYVSTGGRSLYDHEVYQRTEHGDIRVGNLYRYDEAVTYCQRMNEARKR